MPVLTPFRCDACDRTTEHDASKRHAPFGWEFVNIEGRAFTFCNRCAPLAGHGVDVSPALCEQLAARGIHLQVCKDLWAVRPGQQ